MLKNIIWIFVFLLIIWFLFGNKKESFTSFNENNASYWPSHYYSTPYNYKFGGKWPPGLFSRLYNWSPGFYSGSGLSLSTRPGMGYKYYPRNRWIRNTTNGNNSYYRTWNRDDYTHNAANYADVPLRFRS